MQAPGVVAAQPQGIVLQQVTTVELASAWSTGLFDCCADMGICCLGTFCISSLECRTASEFGECCCLPWLCPISTTLRTAIRERYRIPGSILEDFFVSLFCNVCSWCQMARELKNRRQTTTTTTTTTYTAVPQM
ncbi:cornifelin homolog A-like [Lepisosteus oculatus]|uniref:Cornifelin homolog A-like n=1 Tax=Lepisosteus oculatus TaxID=7918 RepID=W5LWF0_LEPOC|nr:PREDICTED: cornifelin homolog A-like [Lepisosteus oculatus]